MNPSDRDQIGRLLQDVLYVLVDDIYPKEKDENKADKLRQKLFLYMNKFRVKGDYE